MVKSFEKSIGLSYQMPPLFPVESGVIKKQLPPKFSASPIIVSFNWADIWKLHIQSNILKIRILVFILNYLETYRINEKCDLKTLMIFS